MLYCYNNDLDSILSLYLDRIYRIFRITINLHHFPACRAIVIYHMDDGGMKMMKPNSARRKKRAKKKYPAYPVNPVKKL